MECDIVFSIGDSESKTFQISREDSSKELSSLDDIIDFISDNWTSEQIEKLLHTLWRSRSRMKSTAKIFLDKPVIGNVSLEDVAHYYPEYKEIINTFIKEKPYNITLIDKAYYGGVKLEGRHIVNGITTYVLTGPYSVDNFVKAEYKKHLIEHTVENNKILDEYLSKKYADKLELIRSKSTKFKKRISKEVDPNFNIDKDPFTIKHLLLDYINNASDYNTMGLIKDKNGLVIDVGSVLNDFCRELNKQRVYNEDLETPLSRALRQIHYKRTQLGKSALYDVLKTLDPDFQLSENAFSKLDVKEMLDVLNPYFEKDPIMSQYVVESVNETAELTLFLKKQLALALFKKVLLAKNEELKAANKLPLTITFDEVMASTETASEFFLGLLTYKIKDLDYPLNIQVSDGEVKFAYLGRKITNNEKVLLRRTLRSMEEEYGFTYNTREVFTPVNTDGVIDGEYKGMYIYEHKGIGDKPIYIVSYSIANPENRGSFRKGSLEDAKLLVDGLVRSANVGLATKIEIKKKIQNDTIGTSINLDFRTYPNQIIDSLYFPIDPKIELPPQEYNLIQNSPASDIIDYYSKFGIDISMLDSPEKVGTFIWGMVLKNITISLLVSKQHEINQEIKNRQEKEANGEPVEEVSLDLISEEDKATILDIIDHLTTKAVYKLYKVNHSVEKDLTKKNIENSEKKRLKVAYLEAITDAGYTINSAGIDVKTNQSVQDISLAKIYNLKNVIENKLFRNTGVHINILTSELLAELTDDSGNLLFPDGVIGIKGFVHNNDIYLNKSTLTINDLVHETLHIMLGAIKANDLKNGSQDYKNILAYLMEKRVNKLIVDTVKKQYSNLANIDLLEECVVRYLARVVELSKAFYYTDRAETGFNYLIKLFLDLGAEVRNPMNKNISEDPVEGLLARLCEVTKENIRIPLETMPESDLQFVGNMKALIKSNLTEMQRNRMVTNLISKGLETENIFENC